MNYLEDKIIAKCHGCIYFYSAQMFRCVLRRWVSFVVIYLSVLSFSRNSIDVENPMSEPAAGQLLQELLDQISLKSEDLTGDEMFPIRLKLNETAREFQVSFHGLFCFFLHFCNYSLLNFVLTVLDL